MKVLTIRPPWADAVACGAKRFETRSWATAYRGPLAIHAGMGAGKQVECCLRQMEFQRALGPLVGNRCDLEGARAWNGITPEQVHRGAIVAVCRLEDCIRCETLPLFAYEDEARLGDFTAGRYAWLLTEVVALTQPVAFRGALGLCTLPAAMRRKVAAALPAGAKVDPVIRRGLHERRTR